ncbi:MAG: hypothetical protein HYX22_00600 [Candidatus Yanofskybacteria bacterium]|nr:hypothetical protein [Candidatus Yanofskybacteria bacterium]
MNYKKLRHIFNSTLAVQIIFIAAIAGAIFVFDRFYGEKPPALKNMSKKEAALFIDFDNMQKVFAGEVVDGMTVLDALNASVTAGQLRLTYYVDGDNNTKIEEINDHAAGGDAQFIFYVNSRKLDQDKLNKTRIKAGDKITITLE